MTGRLDEFDWIERLKPLTRGDPGALGLLDDAAILPGRAGYELVVSTDAMVEGVHFLCGESPDWVARRLLRTSLSDLAAKAAEPFGYFLTSAWPFDTRAEDQEAFIRGLAADGQTFGVSLLGGDTVGTPGPLTLSATVVGWAPVGRAIRRSGAQVGDAIVVCGAIGDGWLGLRSARGEVVDPGGWLLDHFRAPLPLLALRDVLRTCASAAADVSDGLLADLGHVARASGCRASVDIASAPLSPNGAAWLSRQSDRRASLLALATGGDDYALVCAVRPENEVRLLQGATERGVPATRLGSFASGSGLDVRCDGEVIAAHTLGWRH